MAKNHDLTQDDVDRFAEIIEEMKNLLDEARDIAKLGNNITYERARSYWVGHIEGAIDKENSSFMGGSMFDMASTLADLEGDINEDEDEDEE